MFFLGMSALLRNDLHRLKRASLLLTAVSYRQCHLIFNIEWNIYIIT